jgi:hypothetical protein
MQPTFLVEHEGSGVSGSAVAHARPCFAPTAEWPPRVAAAESSRRARQCPLVLRQIYEVSDHRARIAFDKTLTDRGAQDGVDDPPRLRRHHLDDPSPARANAHARRLKPPSLVDINRRNGARSRHQHRTVRQPFTEFPEVACPSSCATALAARDPGRNRSNTTLDRDQSRIGAHVRAVRPHNLLPNCLDRCSFCAPCLSSCQQIRAARLRHPCCGQATVAAAKRKPLHAGPRN